MRRSFVIAVLALVVLAIPALPAFAQAPAAPAPKVTITGLFDQITSAGRNIYDGNFSRDADHEWYARTRFRPDFEWRVGRTAAVLGLEIDFNYGRTGGLQNDGFPQNNTGSAGGFAGGVGPSAASASLGINNDVAGVIKIKYIYTEFDLTGKDSLMPFIPLQTLATAGGQGFGTIANYKVYYANGDFAGLDLATTITPDIKNHLAWVDIEDQLAGQDRTANVQQRTNRGKDFAIIESPEITPFKGLDLKPMFSWFHADGQTANNISRRNSTNLRTVGGSLNGVAAFAGVNPAALVNPPGNAINIAAGDPTLHEERYTLGLDARWRVGAFGLDPTISYQWGSYETQAIRTNGSVGKVEGDASAWLIDVIASYQLGPLLLELRPMYTTGNKARDNLSLAKRYYEPIDLDTGYFSGGWNGIFALGVDYFNGGGGQNQSMSTMIGYDRYGRAELALRATYSITPAWSVFGVVAPTWTAEAVDTHSGCPQPLNVANTAGGCPNRVAVGDKGFVKGESNYLGTELDAGITWRFAPNTAFDLAGYYLVAGSALNTGELLNGSVVTRDARDGYYAGARVRLAF